MIRTEQDKLNLKRMVWKEQGVIGEFETYKKYSYNHLDLNVLLIDLGILHLNTYVRRDDLLKEDREKLKFIQIPRNYFLRFSASRDLRKHISDLQLDLNLEEVGLNEKVALWKETYNKFELLNKRWEKEKMRALVLSYWNVSEKITFEYGTLSRSESPVRYRTDKVFDFLGRETILKNARAEQDKLVEYTARGVLKIKELNNLKKVIDVKRRYLLMTIQKEIKKKEYWYTKLKNLSKLSQR